MNDIIPQDPTAADEMRAIFLGDQASAACGLFARPGQVAADLPAPDQCMRCGRPEREHAAAPGDLGGLVYALIAAGTSVSFVLDPEGVVAHVDVVNDDDTVTPHTGIAATPLGALEAAAFGAGFATGTADNVPVADALAARLAELEGIIAGQAAQLADVEDRADELDQRTGESQTLLIQTLCDLVRERLKA